MAKVLNGRYMADVSQFGDEIVIFMLGIRFNNPWKVRLWWPVITAMPKMDDYLEEHPEKGLLGCRTSYLPPLVVQYWRSFSDLERFARNADDPHLEPWLWPAAGLMSISLSSPRKRTANHFCSWPAVAAAPGLADEVRRQVVAQPTACLTDDFDRAHAGLLDQLA